MNTAKLARAVKAAAISLSLLGCLLTFVALLFGLQALKSSQELGTAVVAAGFAITAGFCFLGGAILTAVQPFVKSDPAP